MFVKKMPVLQWFPDFETAETLILPRLGCTDFRPAFYDIETTGLSRTSTFLYLIGAVVYEDGKWQLYQWLAQQEKDEPLLLQEFARFLKKFTCTVQYNGNQFDQPYLEERYRLYEMKSPFAKKEALDLYKELKPLKALLKLPNLKQPQLEAFLDLPVREHTDGKECIRVYRTYVKSRNEMLKETVLGHNREDVQGLGRILGMLSYLQLFDGKYSPSEAFFDGEHLLLTINLPCDLPEKFSNGTSDFYITGSENTVRLAVKAAAGRLKQYYSNYKEYDYIPSEDTAMPKSLSACLDKSLRRPAKADTCYTWFDCTGSFLQNPAQQLQYLRHTLPYLLGTLK